MIHALPTDDFLTAVRDFDRHARLGRQQVLGNSCRKGACLTGRPWNPLHLNAQAARLSAYRALGPGGRRSAARMGLYPDLGAPESALAVCHDLYEFAHELDQAGGEQGACFVALFKGHALGSEVHFEHLLWRQLQTMHGVDAQYFSAAEAPSLDDATQLHGSFGGRTYVVVGRHQGSGALPRPCLVFYPAWGERR